MLLKSTIYTHFLQICSQPYFCMWAIYNWYLNIFTNNLFYFKKQNIVQTYTFWSHILRKWSEINPNQLRLILRIYLPIILCLANPWPHPFLCLYILEHPLLFCRLGELLDKCFLILRRLRMAVLPATLFVRVRWRDSLPIQSLSSWPQLLSRRMNTNLKPRWGEPVACEAFWISTPTNSSVLIRSSLRKGIIRSGRISRNKVGG